MITLCCIDAHVYDLDTGELSFHGIGVRLEPKPAAVLNYLIARPGTLVSRAALLDDVWRDSIVVDEVLTRAVGLIRKACNDEPPYKVIETLPKRGYRLIAHVTTLPEYPNAVIIEPRSRSDWGERLAIAGVSTRT